MSVTILIDANIILDVLCARAPFVDDSERVLNLCETDLVDGCLSALSIPNLVYVMGKELDPGDIENVIDTIGLLLTVVDLKAKDLKDAAALRLKDFEDALQYVTAKRIRADYIVTRNIKDFPDFGIRSITPADFLALFGAQL